MSATPTLTRASSPQGSAPAAAARPARRPGRPRWTDPRLVAGLLLAVGSALLGARALTAADDSEPVWAAARDLPAGAVLRADDLVVVDLRMSSGAQAYVSAAGEAPTGRSTVRAVSAGELVPAAALDRGPVADHRLVTVPAETFHFPADLTRGDRVDVYATTEQDGVPTPALVLGDVVVAEVEARSARLGGVSGVGVVLSVPVDDVPAVVAATQSAAVDLVRVPGSTP
jgi:Flp pilus assembly protein CpaB